MEWAPKIENKTAKEKGSKKRRRGVVLKSAPTGLEQFETQSNYYGFSDNESCVSSAFVGTDHQALDNKPHLKMPDF